MKGDSLAGIKLPVEARAAAFLSLAVACLFAPLWLRGLTPFWGDMTYLHHPWQAAAAQSLQSGRLPLWDPYVYFGMPMLAKMQNALFYPGQLPCFIFGFSAAAAVFQGLHFWLAGWLTFLWLRALRLPAGAALAGGLVFALGGAMTGHMPFLNHIAVLSLVPGLLLCFRRPVLLALALALAFLAGYPPFLLGAVVVVWGLALALAAPAGSWAGMTASWARVWAAAGALAAVLAACQLLPGAELLALSRRSGGMSLDETLQFGYAWRDLVQWISPWLVTGKRFDPAVEWYQCSYVGFVGALAAVWGLAGLRRRRAAGLAGIALLVLLLILGSANALSRGLWAHFPLLRFIRYPGNVAYLGWPLAALLAAAGFARLRARLRAVALLALAAELAFYAQGNVPAMPRSVFTEAGPLVRYLQAHAAGMRYLLSPLALESHSGSGVRDWKWRLYGMTNDPFRLRSAGNFGEPLVPRTNYAFMDMLYSQSSLAAAAEILPGAGIGWLLTRDRGPDAPGLSYEGNVLWPIFKVSGPVSLAWLLDAAAARDLPAGLPAGPLPPGRPLELRWLREDRYEVSGRGAGWAFIAEPAFPGWRAFLETRSGRSAISALPAWGAFQKVAVPDGPWRLDFAYDPASWRWGRLITLFALLGLGVYWYNLVLEDPGS